MTSFIPASNPSCVRLCLSIFNKLNFSANSFAFCSFSVSNNSTPKEANSNLPDAFKHGPIRNPRAYTLTLLSLIFISISSFNPKLDVLLICLNPSFTIILFSSTKSTTSQTVPIAAYCIKSRGYSSFISNSSYNTCINLKATVAPQILSNG